MVRVPPKKSWFSEIISSEDQYFVAQAMAGLSVFTTIAATTITALPEYLDQKMPATA